MIPDITSEFCVKKLPSEDVVTKEGGKEAIALQTEYENSFSLQQIISIAKRCSYNSPAQRSHPTIQPIHPSNPTYSSEARKTHDVIYF